MASRSARRRRGYFGAGVAGAVILALAAIAVVVIVGRPVDGGTSAGSVPAHVHGDAILFTGHDGTMRSADAAPAGLPRIDVYLDLQCPYCREFETTNADQIEALVSAGRAVLAVHPIAILDRSSVGHRYSTRAANAIAAVANYQPDEVPAALAALYAQQPAEQTAGPDDARIAAILRDAGADDPRIADAIRTERFSTWVTAATKRATGDPKLLNPRYGSFTTPTVLVDGERYDGAPNDAAAFARFATP